MSAVGAEDVEQPLFLMICLLTVFPEHFGA